jgi:hypothetical protein
VQRACAIRHECRLIDSSSVIAPYDAESTILKISQRMSLARTGKLKRIIVWHVRCSIPNQKGTDYEDDDCLHVGTKPVR